MLAKRWLHSHLYWMAESNCKTGTSLLAVIAVCYQGHLQLCIHPTSHLNHPWEIWRIAEFGRREMMGSTAGMVVWPWASAGMAEWSWASAGRVEWSWTNAGMAESVAQMPLGYHICTAGVEQWHELSDSDEHQTPPCPRSQEEWVCLQWAPPFAELRQSQRS